MPRVTIPTVTANQAIRASWGNTVKGNDEDHETRIVTLESGGGTGDVVGPSSSTDHAITRYDGTTGKLVQGSGITIGDAASGTLAGSNSGDVTLAGTPNYLTLAAQVLTRALIDLASHVTGRLPWANVVQVTGNRLLGRVSGTGDAQEIAIGSGLALDGAGLRVTAAGGGTPALDDLTDVAITTPAIGDVPQYDGSGWVNGESPLPAHYASPEHDAGTSGTAKTIDWNDGNTQLLQLTGNVTLTLSNPKSGGRYLIALEQDGTGTHTVTWPSSVKWSAGTAPTITTGAGKVSIVTLVRLPSLGASGNYLAAANLDYTPA